VRQSQRTPQLFGAYQRRPSLAHRHRFLIEGERKIAAEGGGVSYHRREREAGTFQRIISLPTRVDAAKAVRIKKALPALTYHPASRLLTLQTGSSVNRGRGTILVVSAGTSDIPVAEEALVTASLMGNTVDHLYDVGVAGIHRLMVQKEKLFAASVLIVVAGMEGALPSVIGGMVEKPVIAVPTSTGYGTGFGGFAALLSMLNSCASGIAVVNIDNGFGAGYIASLINRV
jgi:hypothetical protein